MRIYGSESEMGHFVKFRFYSSDDIIITLPIDPDFSVQLIDEIDFYEGIQEIWWHGKAHCAGIEILIFCRNYFVSGMQKTAWMMHEFPIVESLHLLYPNSTSVFINHVAENTQNLVVPGQLPSCYRNHVAENTCCLVEAPRQPSYFTNHVAENTFVWVECQLSSHHLTFNTLNHVAENILSKKLNNYQVIIYGRNDVAENMFSRVDSQLLQSEHLAFDLGRNIAET